jgi:hypothetical protein
LDAALQFAPEVTGMEWIVGALCLVTGWLGATALEYFKTKGKNLADKEDVAAITRLVEDVKHENAVLLEQLKGRGQLRMAIAEQRVAAHQKAYTLWRDMMFSVHGDRAELHQKVMACQQFWTENCLYLSARSRQAFNVAYMLADGHASMVNGPRSAELIKDIQKYWELMNDAGKALVEDVDLPSLGDTEAKRVS